MPGDFACLERVQDALLVVVADMLLVAAGISIHTTTYSVTVIFPRSSIKVTSSLSFREFSGTFLLCFPASINNFDISSSIVMLLGSFVACSVWCRSPYRRKFYSLNSTHPSEYDSLVVLLINDIPAFQIFLCILLLLN